MSSIPETEPVRNPNKPSPLTLTGPANYQISVKGVLDARWTAWFEGMEITAVSHQTIISGTVADQAALHSLLAKIRDLGLPLISVRLIDPIAMRHSTADSNPNEL